MVNRKTSSCLPSSVPAEITRPLAVVCHDAGAANLIVPWVVDHLSDTRVCVAGPAERIWRETFPVCPTFPMEQALAAAQTLISGTGWSSDLEHNARVEARRRGIYTVGVLDHWTNYRERFIRKDICCLPDEIWVTDPEAFFEAERCFPGTRIRQLRNVYADTIVARVQRLRGHISPSARNVLYILEPIRQPWSRDEVPGEEQAFEFFAAYLRQRDLAGKVTLKLRPHPSDPPDKYQGWHRKFPDLNLSFNSSEALAEQLAWADWVAGCESFALVVALLAGRVVISTLPPWAPRCSLPHSGLVHLRDLL